MKNILKVSSKLWGLLFLFGNTLLQMIPEPKAEGKGSVKFIDTLPLVQFLQPEGLFMVLDQNTYEKDIYSTFMRRLLLVDANTTVVGDFKSPEFKVQGIPIKSSERVKISIYGDPAQTHFVIPMLGYLRHFRINSISTRTVIEIHKNTPTPFPGVKLYEVQTELASNFAFISHESTQEHPNKIAKTYLSKSESLVVSDATIPDDILTTDLHSTFFRDDYSVYCGKLAYLDWIGHQLITNSNQVYLQLLK